jgi:hypothetical protein
MPTVEQHYDQVLSDVYSWMQGGFDAALARNTEFFAGRGIAPAGSRIAIVRDDLMTFDEHVRGPAELAICMVDTLLHLPSNEAVRTLFAKVHAALEPGGRFIATFRDLSREAIELDRFIPVRSDDRTIFTCFLEYEPDTVKVHDLVHRKSGDAWTFRKSFYRKLRLAQQWVTEQLAYAGFGDIDAAVERGLVTVIATR